MNSATKQLCLKCKSFYGSEIYKGHCSVCYDKISESLSPEIKVNKNQTEEIKEDIILQNTNTSSVIQEKPVQVKTDVCWKCEKRVGYLGFTCRCSYTFCNAHRHFSDHNCDFDYKTLERERLRKENPLVASKKI